MTKKVLNKVCIDCVNSNEHIKIGAEFKVGVEFGTCDCCGRRYIIVPFGRFFDDKVELVPCTAKANKKLELKEPVVDVKPQNNKGNKNQKNADVKQPDEPKEPEAPADDSNAEPKDDDMEGMLD